MKHIADRIYEKMDEKKTPLCIGLDPNLELFPNPLLQKIADEQGVDRGAAANAIRVFNFSGYFIAKF